jgi:hypothetical protein
MGTGCRARPYAVEVLVACPKPSGLTRSLAGCGIERTCSRQEARHSLLRVTLMKIISQLGAEPQTGTPPLSHSLSCFQSAAKIDFRTAFYCRIRIAG